MEFFNHPVDRILEENVPYKLSVLKLIAGNNPIFFEHFPGDPVYPGSMILNTVLLTLGIFVMKSENRVYAEEELRLENIKFKNKCRPGDLLKVEVEAVQREKIKMDHTYGEYRFYVERYYSGAGICRGKIIAEAEGRQCG